MSVFKKSLPLSLILNTMLPFFVFSVDVRLDSGSEVRGFSMGERYATVLKQEQAREEFTLQESSEASRLIFDGTVLGEQASIIYSFRAQRLTSLCYVWQMPSENPIFLEKVKNLLARKYKLADTKKLEISSGNMNYQLYGDKKIPPTLIAELEVLPPEDPENELSFFTIALEFRAPDTDNILMKKILSEDI